MTMVRHGLLLRLLGTAAVIAMFYAGWLTTLRHVITDSRFVVTARPATGSIVLAEIDAATLARTDAWPWSRSVHAALVDRLRAAGVSDIAFDIDFSAQRDQAGDAAFRDALKHADGVVVLAALQQRAGHDDAGLIATHPLPAFLEASWEASVNVEPDADGLIRVLARGTRFGTTLLPALPVLLSGTPSIGSGTYAVDYGIDSAGIDRVSVADVLAGHIDPVRLREKKVIVGATAIELRDYYQVPRYGPIPGALLQAIAADALLQERALQPVDPAVSLALCLVVLVMAWLCRGLDLWLNLLVSAAAAVAVEGSAVALQRTMPLVLDTSPVHIALLVLAGLAVVLEIENRRIKMLASRGDADRLRVMLDRVVADNFAGIVVVDRNGIVRALSRAASELLGVEANGAGRHAAQVLPAALLAALQDAEKRAETGRSSPAASRQIEVRLRPEQGTVVLDYVTTVSTIPATVTETGRHMPGQQVICLTFQDVTERRRTEARIERLAHYDTLTELANRHAFVSRLATALDRPLADRSCLAVLYLDIDRFKAVNDRLGNHCGDALLQAVARRLAAAVRPGDLVARLGGDEFALLIERDDEDAVTAFAEQLVSMLGGVYDLVAYQVAMDVSVGAATAGSCTAEELMKRADAALSVAKAAGGGRMRLYDVVLAEMVEAGRLLELDLRGAIGRNELQVFYQRQVDAVTETIVGVEALVRWKHPRLGDIPPTKFIPIAERTGAVEEIGAWVLRVACRDAMLWPRPVKVSVNLSAVQLSRGDLVDTVASALAESGLPAKRLDLELTESLLMENDGFARGILDRIRGLGVGLSLDDFGTGYSSLAYLKSFDIDKIKIDRSFVKDLPDDQSSVAIIRAVVTLAQSLGLRVNTEGVETTEQMATVRALGCDEIQGFLHGRPEPAAAIEISLRAELRGGLHDMPLSIAS